MKNGEPSSLEREAIVRALSPSRFSLWRKQLLAQLDAAKVVSRTEKTCGYYADFVVPRELRVNDAPDEWVTNPPESNGVHPDGKNAVFFVLYIKDGLLSFLEAASTDSWPEDEGGITFAGPERVD